MISGPKGPIFGLTDKERERLEQREKTRGIGCPRCKDNHLLQVVYHHELPYPWQVYYCDRCGCRFAVANRS